MGLGRGCLGVGELLLGNGRAGVPYGGLEVDLGLLVNVGRNRGGHGGLQVCVGKILGVQVRLGVGHPHGEAGKGCMEALRMGSVIL